MKYSDNFLSAPSVFLKFSNYVRICAFSPCLEWEMYAGVSRNHRLLWKQRGSQRTRVWTKLRSCNSFVGGVDWNKHEYSIWNSQSWILGEICLITGRNEDGDEACNTRCPSSSFPRYAFFSLTHTEKLYVRGWSWLFCGKWHGVILVILPRMIFLFLLIGRKLINVSKVPHSKCLNSVQFDVLIV